MLLQPSVRIMVVLCYHSTALVLYVLSSPYNGCITYALTSVLHLIISSTLSALFRRGSGWYPAVPPNNACCRWAVGCKERALTILYIYTTCNGGIGRVPYTVQSGYTEIDQPLTTPNIVHRMHATSILGNASPAALHLEYTYILLSYSHTTVLLYMRDTV